MAATRASAALPQLHYFRGRGRAEAIRFVMALACPEGWEDVYVETAEAMEALRACGRLAFGQLPYLNIDGKDVVQTGAILRHLARRGGLYGANDDQRMRCDVIADGATDFVSAGFMHLPFSTYMGANREARLLEMTTGATAPVPKYLAMFERLAAANAEADDGASGFMVGTSTTYADLTLLQGLEYTREVEAELRAFGHDDDLMPASQYPALIAVHKRLLALPQVQAFLASPHRHIIGDDPYAEAVQLVLSRPPPTPAVAPASAPAAATAASGAGASSGTGSK